MVKPLLLLPKEHNSWTLFLTALPNSQHVYETVLNEITITTQCRTAPKLLAVSSSFFLLKTSRNSKDAFTDK